MHVKLCETTKTSGKTLKWSHHGDVILLKLFTLALEEVFKTSEFTYTGSDTTSLYSPII